MKKKFIALLMVSLLTISMSTPVCAASRVSGGVAGTPCSGHVTTTSDSAIATTEYGRPGSLHATATVYSWFGKGYRRNRASSSNSLGGTSAVAVKDCGGAQVIGGKGEHSVSGYGQTWSGTTTTGTIKD